ncbi:hypothetical protein CEXT_2821 [Caerostris extrusa]|uniref:Uncharacterized protein n=1 Tax=Caerostris extrusa TaxID=172846 RepID=A0AAV4QZ35_CAEEX|nr:hypothetical protein CEXT_2821 [Caerostris extrusa]
MLFFSQQPPSITKQKTNSAPPDPFHPLHCAVDHLQLRGSHITHLQQWLQRVICHQMGSNRKFSFAFALLEISGYHLSLNTTAWPSASRHLCVCRECFRPIYGVTNCTVRLKGCCHETPIVLRVSSFLRDPGYTNGPYHSYESFCFKKML